MAKETAALRKHKAKIASLGMDSDAVFHKSKLLLRSTGMSHGQSVSILRKSGSRLRNSGHDIDAGILISRNLPPTSRLRNSPSEYAAFAKPVCILT